METSSSTVEPAQDTPIVVKLKELGTVMIPTSLVALVCKLFEASPEQTSVASLYVIVVLYLVLYRKTINQRVRSSGLLVLIVSFFAVAAFFARQVTSFGFFRRFSGSSITSTVGIVDYQERSNDFLPRLRELSAGASQEIWFVGMNFYVSAPQLKDDLLERLRHGVTVRYLIYDFLSDDTTQVALSSDLPQVARSFDNTPDELLSQSIQTVESLQQLAMRAEQEGVRGRFEVRLFKTIPRARLYFFDPESPTGYTFFVPYTNRKDSPNLPGLLLHNVKGGMFESYFLSTNQLWHDSEPLEHWIGRYRAFQAARAAPRPPPAPAADTSQPAGPPPAQRQAGPAAVVHP